MNHGHHTTTMTTTIKCDGALSDAVLQAARAAIPSDPSIWYADRQVWRHAGPKNEPLLPLFDALIDAAFAVAKAIGDNAWDDSLPLDRRAAEGLANACYRLGAEITHAAQCPDAASWSLPSMSGKELV
jgi:hypothetical protein